MMILTQEASVMFKRREKHEEKGRERRRKNRRRLRRRIPFVFAVITISLVRDTSSARH